MSKSKCSEGISANYVWTLPRHMMHTSFAHKKCNSRLFVACSRRFAIFVNSADHLGTVGFDLILRMARVRKRLKMKRDNCKAFSYRPPVVKHS